MGLVVGERRDREESAGGGDGLRTGSPLSSPAARAIGVILKGLGNSAPSALRTAPRAPNAGAAEPAARWLLSFWVGLRGCCFLSPPLPLPPLRDGTTLLPLAVPFPSGLKTAQRLGSLPRKAVLSRDEAATGVVSSRPEGWISGFPSADRFLPKVSLLPKRSHARKAVRKIQRAFKLSPGIFSRRRHAIRGQGKGRSNFEWGSWSEDFWGVFFLLFFKSVPIRFLLLLGSVLRNQGEELRACAG